MKATKEIADTFGFPAAGVVLHDGLWYKADEMRVPNIGEFYWNRAAKTVVRCFSHCDYVFLILRPAAIPARPTDDWLAAQPAPEGKKWVIDGELPTLEGKCFVAIMENCGPDAGCIDEGDIEISASKSLFHGLRWRVKLVDKPVEKVRYLRACAAWCPSGENYAVKLVNGKVESVSQPIIAGWVGQDWEELDESHYWGEITAAEYEAEKAKAVQPAEPVEREACGKPAPMCCGCANLGSKECPKERPAAWIGLNPEKLGDDVLAKMPEVARLLECEDERVAFGKAGHKHDDLWITQGRDKKWTGDCFGEIDYFTYCTTRPRGWWRKPSEKPAPALTLGDVPVGAVVQRTNGDEYLVVGRHTHRTYSGVSNGEESTTVVTGWRWPQETEWRMDAVNELKGKVKG